MSSFYEDDTLRLDEQGLTLKSFTLSGRAKHLAWNDIRAFRVRPLTLWSGKYRLAGMGLAPVWFGADLARPVKEKLIEIDFGSLLRAGVTPVDADAVAELIASHGIVRH